MADTANTPGMAGTDADEQRVLADVPKGLFIGGGWRETGRTVDVEDPATGETLCEVADGGAEDAVAALDAACAAQDGWAATAPRERGEILHRAYEAITGRVDDLALLMTLEMGKPLEQSRGEVSYAAEFLRWFAEEAVRIEGRYGVSPDGDGRIMTIRQPVGPCLFVTPWNFPLAMGTRKIGPAVAAGCTMVVKPATQTPLSMLALAEILAGAGLPDGVLNLVVGSDAAAVTEPVLSDPRLRKLSFTGSTPVGRMLMGKASENLLRVSMELGGNAPFLVFADADLEDAVDGAMVAKMRNIGEACTAANRFIVHESVVADFTDALAERMGAMKIGRGTEEDVEVGPLIDGGQREKVVELVADAVDRGAKPVLEGGAIDGPGWFYAPGVLTDIPDDARLLSEEIFGPVAPVQTFAEESEGLAMANDTEFGLVAYAYTRDLDRALRVVEGLESGMVGVNAGKVSNPAAPFGGVKHSGFGREGGYEGIDEYLETKYAKLAL